jgi:hypothetical protein
MDSKFADTGTGLYLLRRNGKFVYLYFKNVYIRLKLIVSVC